MIHHQISASVKLAPHACGQSPQLIETRGRQHTDFRLLGAPSCMYHVECGRCGIATAPTWSQMEAERRWTSQDFIVDSITLPVLRLEAERAMANAA